MFTVFNTVDWNTIHLNSAGIQCAGMEPVGIRTAKSFVAWALRRGSTAGEEPESGGSLAQLVSGHGSLVTDLWPRVAESRGSGFQAEFRVLGFGGGRIA